MQQTNKQRLNYDTKDDDFCVAVSELTSFIDSTTNENLSKQRTINEEANAAEFV